MHISSCRARRFVAQDHLDESLAVAAPVGICPPRRHRRTWRAGWKGARGSCPGHVDDHVRKAELDGGEFFHPGIVEHGLGLTVGLAAGLDEFQCRLFIEPFTEVVSRLNF
jgi:hypothetical protein